MGTFMYLIPYFCYNINTMDNKPVKNDVFEMILASANGQKIEAQARPADFVLPSSWQEEQIEGQLAVDVAQTEKEVIIVSTMAGAMPDQIEVYLHNDLLTIRGRRISPLNGREAEYFLEECFWGKFSRTIILPMEVKGDLARAEYHNGVLTIWVPKQKIDRQIPVMIVDE